MFLVHTMPLKLTNAIMGVPMKSVNAKAHTAIEHPRAYAGAFASGGRESAAYIVANHNIAAENVDEFVNVRKGILRSVKYQMGFKLRLECHLQFP